MQEDERGHVAGQAEELAHDHQPVPGLDGESHHQQLGEDERGEGDGHDVHELRLEEQQRSVHDDASCKSAETGGQIRVFKFTQTSSVERLGGTCTRR